MGKQEQKILGIYHSHSKFSKLNHGKDFAEDMIAESKRLGLEEYAITDHGYRHVFGIRRKNVKKLRKIVDNANKDGKTKILMGLEFNLLGIAGEIDTTPEISSLVDIKLMGVHKAGMVNFKNFFRFLLPNILNGKSQKVINRNTDAYINAIVKHKIDIVTHPQEYFKVDLVRLAIACVENNCYLEINNKHLKISENEMAELLKTNVKFIVSSDAHQKENILRVNDALAFLEKCGVPEERVANLNKLPNFKEKY